MKVKTLVLSFSQEKKAIIVNLNRCINLTDSFIKKYFMNLKFDTRPFFKQKYFNKDFKFLSISYGSIDNEFIFKIKYRTKKDLNKRLEKIFNYSTKNGKSRQVILSKDVASDFYFLNLLDNIQDLNKEFLQKIIDRVNSGCKVILVGEDAQVSNDYIAKCEKEWLDYVLEPAVSNDYIAKCEKEWLDYVLEPAISDEEYVEASKFTSDTEIDISTVEFRESTAESVFDQYQDVFNSPSPIIPFKEVFFINYGQRNPHNLDQKVEPIILDKDKPTIQVNSHFRGTKEQKELLLKIRENKSKYSRFNKTHSRHSDSLNQQKIEFLKKELRKLGFKNREGDN